MRRMESVLSYGVANDDVKENQTENVCLTESMKRRRANDMKQDTFLLFTKTMGNKQ